MAAELGAVSARKAKHWLLAYDIRNPKRLRKIHAYLRKRGYSLQYSVFGLELDDHGIRRILDDLVLLMDPSVDDIRAYHLPEHCQVWTIGQQALPEGIELHATAIMRLLMRQPQGSASTTQDLFPNPLATVRRTRNISRLESEQKPRSQGD